MTKTILFEILFLEIGIGLVFMLILNMEKVS